MDLRKQHEKLAADHRTVKYNFILTELDLANTFCEMAIASGDRAKSERNTENAQRAYKAAAHFLEENDFSGEMRANVGRKITKIKTCLNELNGQTARFASR